MTKYDDYKKAMENAKINRPEYRSENKTFCYPDEYEGVVVGIRSSELVILGIDDAIMMANFILDTFTDRGSFNPQDHEQTK